MMCWCKDELGQSPARYQQAVRADHCIPRTVCARRGILHIIVITAPSDTLLHRLARCTEPSVGSLSNSLMAR